MKDGKIHRRLRVSSGSFVAGLGALAALWPNNLPTHPPHRSDMQALRGDAQRIGDDMRRVIVREHARVKKITK